MEVSVSKQVKIVKTASKPAKAPPEKFPWPRFAPDDPKVALGIDTVAKMQDIKRIVHKHFRVPDVPMDELLQEIFLAITRKNYTMSAHDPRKSSFSHYIYMISDNVCKNLVNRKKRYDREKDSIDAPANDQDSRTLLDVIDVPTVLNESDDVVSNHMEDIENVMRRQGYRDLARYIRAVRSGASPDVIKEALSWGDRKISSKNIRVFRTQVKSVITDIIQEPVYV
jgi:DNA-directed RNA polymerase specialized sigma24 family protein